VGIPGLEVSLIRWVEKPAMISRPVKGCLSFSWRILCHKLLVYPWIVPGTSAVISNLLIGRVTIPVIVFPLQVLDLAIEALKGKEVDRVQFQT
jgi:hypothetical protein